MTMSFPSAAPPRLQGLSPRSNTTANTTTTTATISSKLVGSALAVFESNLVQQQQKEPYSTRRSHLPPVVKTSSNSPKPQNARDSAAAMRPFPAEESSSSSSGGSDIVRQVVHVPVAAAVAAPPLTQTRRKLIPATATSLTTAKHATAAAAAPTSGTLATTTTSLKPSESAEKIKKTKKVVTRVVKRVKQKEGGDESGQQLAAQSDHATKTRRPATSTDGLVVKPPSMKRGKSQPPRAESSSHGSSDHRQHTKQRQPSLTKRPMVQPINLEEQANKAAVDNKYRRSKSQPRTAGRSDSPMKQSRPATDSRPRLPTRATTTNANSSSRAVLQSQPQAQEVMGGLEIRKVKSARHIDAGADEVVSRGTTTAPQSIATGKAQSTRQMGSTMTASQEHSRRLERDIASIQAELVRLAREKEPASESSVAASKDRQGRFERKPPPRTRSRSEPHKRPEGDEEAATRTPETTVRSGQRRVVGRVPRRRSNPDAPPPQSPTSNAEQLPQSVRRIGRVPRRQPAAVDADPVSRVALVESDLVERDRKVTHSQDDSFQHARNKILQRHNADDKPRYPSSAPSHSTGKGKLSAAIFTGLRYVPLTDSESNKDAIMNDHSAGSGSSRVRRSTRQLAADSEASESFSSSVDLYYPCGPVTQSRAASKLDASKQFDDDASEPATTEHRFAAVAVVKDALPTSLSGQRSRRPIGRVPRPAVLAVTVDDTRETNAAATVHPDAVQAVATKGRGTPSSAESESFALVDADAQLSQPTKRQMAPLQSNTTEHDVPASKLATSKPSNMISSAKPLKRRVFPVNDSVTPMNPDGKRKVAGSIIAGRLAGLALDDSPCPTSNPLSLQERIKIFQAASGVKNELLHIPDKTRIGRPVMSFAQKRKKGAIKIQALVRGIIQRNADRKHRAIVRLQSFARMVAPRQAFRLRLLYRKYVATLRSQRDELLLVHQQKASGIKYLKKKHAAKTPKLSSMEPKDEEQLRDLFLQNSGLQQSNAKLQEMRVALENMSQMNDMTQAAQMQSLRTLQGAVGVLTEKNDALTRQAQKYEERIDTRSAELTEMRARIVYESTVRKLMEQAVAGLVDRIESRCKDEALVRRVIAISADEDFVETEQECVVPEDEELSMASDDLKAQAAPKKSASTDGFELSFRVMGLDDDDVSELCSSEHMLMQIVEEGEYEVEYDEITVEDSLDPEVDDADTLNSDDASSVWDGNHEIII